MWCRIRINFKLSLLMLEEPNKMQNMSHDNESEEQISYFRFLIICNRIFLGSVFEAKYKGFKI